MILVRYTSAQQSEWDAFVRTSRNGTFLFERPYMDYHSDRFTDHSLMYYDDKHRLLALLPANEQRNEGQALFYSHQGLTYGGFVLSQRAKSADVMSLFEQTLDYLRREGFSKWYYRPVPTIYHRLPSQEEEYALWRLGAQQDRCLLAATVELRTADDLFQSTVKKTVRTYRNGLLRAGYCVDERVPLAEFWPILTDNLMRTYHAVPVHSLDEMERLQQSFPQRIRCAGVRDAEGVLLAGVVLYLDTMVVHTQYISASARGKEENVLDLLLYSLIESYRECHAYAYFDFGTNNEAGGLVLNASLIAQKEGFGARGVVYRGYSLDV